MLKRKSEMLKEKQKKPDVKKNTSSSNKKCRNYVKADIVKPTFAMEWMKDFETFQAALDNETSYMGDLTRSMSLVLDEFYKDLKCVSTSAVTGEGSDSFFDMIDKLKTEFESEYRPEYERLRKEKDAALVAEQARQLERVKLDISKDKHSSAQMYTRSDLLKERGIKIHIGSAAAALQDDIDEEEARRQALGEEEEDPDEKKEREEFIKSLQTCTKNSSADTVNTKHTVAFEK